MRFAVVHFAVIFYRQFYACIILRDRQCAGFIGYIVIGRNSSVVVFDGLPIDLVLGTARVGDGGGRRHGEGEVLLRVAVDQTLHCEIGLGQRLTVVGLARILGLDGQGHSVIERDDIFGFVSRDRDGLRESISGGHHGIYILGFQARARTRRQRFADGLGAGLVFGNLDGGAVQVMVDGVARGVELEVQLQHQRAVACDGAGKHVVRVVLIEHVLVVFLSRLIGVGNGNFRVRGGLALVAVVERVIAIDILLIVELDGVLGVGVRRPDGVEDVVAVVVYLHGNLLSNNGVGASFIVALGRPARKAVARAGEGVCDGGDGRVVGEVFNHVLACAAIGLIGQGGASGTRAPLGGEDDDVLFIGVIALDLILVAGLVGGRAIRPAEEVLTISSNQLARGHEVSKAALRVGLAIHRSGYIVFDDIVFNFEGALFGIVGLQFDVRVNRGILVEGPAVHIAPAMPFILVAVLVQLAHYLFLPAEKILRINRIAVLNIRNYNLRLSINCDRQMDFCIENRLNPLCIDRDVLRGHGLAGEVIGLFACRVRIPAAEFIAFHVDGLGIRRIRTRIRNALFELLGSGVYRLTAAHIEDLVGVAGVVEFGVVVWPTIGCTFFIGKAGNRILIFLAYAIASAGTGIRMVQLIGNAVMLLSRLARKHFYIVVGRFGAVAGLRAIEFSAVQWHCINVYLRGRTTVSS